MNEQIERLATEATELSREIARYRFGPLFTQADALAKRLRDLPEVLLDLNTEEVFMVKCMRGRRMTGCSDRRRGELTYYWVDGLQPSDTEIKELLGDTDPVIAAEKYLARYLRMEYGGGRREPERRPPPAEKYKFTVTMSVGIPLPPGAHFDAKQFGLQLEHAVEEARQSGQLDVEGMPEGVSWVSFADIRIDGKEAS